MKVFFENTPVESPAKTSQGKEGGVKRIALFGSTGSIGTQALNVIAANPDKFSAEVLTAQTNGELINSTSITIQSQHCCYW
jgi:1-deoxy-D-xylulose 5-phosphate reductoisomerase